MMYACLKLADGSLTTIHIVDVDSGLDAAAVVQAEINKSKMSVSSFREVAYADLPGDETFRNAWSDDGKQVTIDMTKARDIQRNRMRDARAPKLAALDVAFQRAQESGADTSAVVAKKQALRNVTADPAIEAAQTPDELKNVWPDCLKEE